MPNGIPSGQLVLLHLLVAPLVGLAVLEPVQRRAASGGTCTMVLARMTSP